VTQSTQIHPAAIVDPAAALGAGVTVGAFALIEADVTVGDGCRIEAHSVVRAGTTLGRHNIVHPFAVLGGDAQDRRYHGEPARLDIGERNTFREHVTVHRGTAHGGGITRIGAGGLFMAGVHIGHDALVGDAVTLANDTLIGGHVALGDHVTCGGRVAIAPFVRVGSWAFLAAGAMVERDVPPFVIAAGDRATVRALNKVGLDRAGVPPASRAALKHAFRAIFRSATPRRSAAEAFSADPDPYVRDLSVFLQRVRA